MWAAPAWQRFEVRDSDQKIDLIPEGSAEWWYGGERISSGEGWGSAGRQKHNGRFYAANELYRSSRYAEAVEQYIEALRVESANPEILYWRGRSYLLTGREAEALADFEEVVERSPHHADAHLNLAYLADRRGDWDRCIDHLDKAISLKPDRGDAYGRRGRCYYYKGDLESSFKDAERGCALGDQNSCRALQSLRK
jgi:tetratricopeptide (TPR) repeat protein